MNKERILKKIETIENELKILKNLINDEEVKMCRTCYHTDESEYSSPCCHCNDHEYWKDLKIK